jgi:hypothetical protein
MIPLPEIGSLQGKRNCEKVLVAIVFLHYAEYDRPPTPKDPPMLVRRITSIFLFACVVAAATVPSTASAGNPSTWRDTGDRQYGYARIICKADGEPARGEKWVNVANNWVGKICPDGNTMYPIGTAPNPGYTAPTPTLPAPPAVPRYGINDWGHLFNGTNPICGWIMACGVTDWDLDITSWAGMGYNRMLIVQDWADPNHTGSYNWASTDQVVLRAAQHGQTILPIIQTPKYPATDAQRSLYRSYTQALAARYGTGGDFWKYVTLSAGVPYRPMQAFELGNESNQGVPDGSYGTVAADFAKSEAAGAWGVRAGNSKVKIILGGFAPNNAADYYKQVHNAGAVYDAVSVHPYAPTPTAALDIVQRVRNAMNDKSQNTKPLWITEWGWATEWDGYAKKANHDAYRSVANTSIQGQYVGQFATMLDNHRDDLRLGGNFYFALHDRYNISQAEVIAAACCVSETLDYAGLMSLGSQTGRPAWGALTSHTSGKYMTP